MEIFHTEAEDSLRESMFTVPGAESSAKGLQCPLLAYELSKSEEIYGRGKASQQAEPSFDSFADEPRLNERGKGRKGEK